MNILDDKRQTDNMLHKNDVFPVSAKGTKRAHTGLVSVVINRRAIASKSEFLCSSEFST